MLYYKKDIDKIIGVQFMKTIEIKNKRIVKNKLIPFGFKHNSEGFSYSEFILDTQFELKLFVNKDFKLSTQLIETAVDYEYVLHLVPDAQGEFVGKVKSAYNSVLDKFIKNCCETDMFKSEQALEIIEYVRNTYQDELEYLWEKFPNNAIVRRKDNKCWYLILIKLSRRKLGFDSDEIVDIIDLRISTESVRETIDGKKYLSAYHMNKQHWFTLVLDGSVSTNEIFDRINESYALAKKQKKSKKSSSNK